MKILFIITGLGVGGAETQVCKLITELVKRGNQVKVISLSGEKIISPEIDDSEVIELHMKKNIFGFIMSYLKIISVIRDFRPDVIHSHMFHANIISRLSAAMFTNIKLICTAHSKNEGGHLRMFIYRLTDFLCDTMTNVSQEAVDEFIKLKAVKKDKIIAIHNGIDLEKFSPNINFRKKIRNELSIDKSTTVLMAIGRLTEAKDYPNLINAFDNVRRNNERVRLFIVGSGEEEHTIRLQVENLGLGNYVSFLGMRLDIPELLNACDLFILSSKWEGFGLVVAEAMACKRLVVATDCGGVKEVVGDAGILVESSNTSLLSKSIDIALNLSLTKKNKLCNLARKRIIEHYSMNSVVNKWIELYK
ncbi:glycosyltransferase [Photobacterium leiognathi]|uniref:glycosyltransferase n=1 Tax=Photobacterium leiognathi TaxID=553611 RepID=UPI002980ED07|nr:glycosyltransferase [Photobacterium leiognathi]